MKTPLTCNDRYEGLQSNLIVTRHTWWSNVLLPVVDENPGSHTENQCVMEPTEAAVITITVASVTHERFQASGVKTFAAIVKDPRKSNQQQYAGRDSHHQKACSIREAL
jgi:hypothetical protein